MSKETRIGIRRLRLWYAKVNRRVQRRKNVHTRKASAPDDREHSSAEEVQGFSQEVTASGSATGRLDTVVLPAIPKQQKHM